MKSARVLFLVAILALGLAGCSQQSDVLGPDPDEASLIGKDGTETLGVPSIAIAAGSGFAEGGVGMVGADSGVINLTVPAGATVEQVLLYWAGGTTAAAGDDQISLNGTMVQGTLIGGPTLFYNHVDDYNFSAYRADITGLGLVSAGANSVTVSDFDFAGTTADESNGASIVVIYDDGTNAEITMLDGLDMAYFNFGPTLDTTVPQTFPVVAAAVDRVADLLIICGSVQMGRANQIKVTTIAGDQVFESPMGSTDGMWWDSLLLPVNVPAGATAVTVQVISTPSMEPQGSSLGWVVAGLAVPVTGIETPPAALGDRVWVDTNRNGIQDFGEVGLAGVTVHLLDCAGARMDTTVTDLNGLYRFSNLLPGDYMVHFVSPAGYEFTLQNVGSDAMDSDADANGATICTTLIAGETDLTWDAGLYLPEAAPAALGDRVWVDTNRNGIQDSGEPGLAGVTVHLRNCAGATLATTVTDWNGLYRFSNLLPGDYMVHFVSPAGYEFTLQNVGNDAMDSDADANGATTCTTLIAGETDLTWDAGLYLPEAAPAALGDRVWVDTNRNGIQDSGEPGLAGVTVHLRNCAGATLATTVTDWSGLYRFSNLLPGDYMVHFVSPVGYEFTLQNVGNDAKDSDAGPNGATTCTTLIAGETDLTWDAGLYMPAQGGCTLTIGFWKNHAGFGPQADVLTPLLPIYLGDMGGAETLLVDSAAEAVAILKMKDYGGGSNGIAKLYAQLLAAKLNVANGADDSDIADAIDDAGEFLAMYDHRDWNSLTKAQKNFVNRLMSMFDRYNNGEIGPGHCDDGDDGDDDDDDDEDDD